MRGEARWWARCTQGDAGQEHPKIAQAARWAGLPQLSGSTAGPTAQITRYTCRHTRSVTQSRCRSEALCSGQSRSGLSLPLVDRDTRPAARTYGKALSKMLQHGAGIITGRREWGARRQRLGRSTRIRARRWLDILERQLAWRGHGRRSRLDTRRHHDKNMEG